jgi:enoyl-CoA hydratase/carnithine racemase
MAAVAYEHILYSTHRRRATIALNRPAKLNAITPLMAREVRAALAEAEADEAIRVVVLRGEGRAFSAGFDLSPRPPATTSNEWRERFEPVNSVCRAIWDMPKPVVAQVHGPCLGAAFDVVMACDLAVSADNASFGEPEVRLGGTCQFLLLPWLVGMKTVKHLLLTGDAITAADALAVQLVNRVVPLADLEAAVEAVCRRLATVPRGTVALNKRALNRTYEQIGVAEAIQASEDRAILAALGPSDEARELIRAIEQHGLKAALARLEADYD